MCVLSSSTMPSACCITSGRTTASPSPRCSTSSPSLVWSLPSPTACSSGSLANCWTRRREGEQTCSNRIWWSSRDSLSTICCHLYCLSLFTGCILSSCSQSRQPPVRLHRELSEEQEWDGGVRGCLCHRSHAQLYSQGAGPGCVWSVVYS